jgi:two-component system sensor histidine kinase CpxA
MQGMFFKLFLSFFLTVILGGGLSMIAFSTFMDVAVGRSKNNMSRNYDEKFARLTATSGQAALEIYRCGGKAGYDTYINGLFEADRTKVFLIGDDNHTITGDKVADEFVSIAENARISDKTYVRHAGRNLTVAQKITSKEGISNIVIGVQTFDFPLLPPRDKSGPFFRRNPPPFFAAAAIIRTTVTLIVVSAVCYFLASSLTKPIKRLQKAAQRIAGGDYSARVGEMQGRSGNEITDLGRDFDIMADRTEKVIHAQNRLLCDISHELRSPLARLNVALELAKQRLNADNDSALMKIGQESSRLNELIGQLLILNRLESGGKLNNFSPVNVTELLLEVIEDCNFEASQKERGVKILSSSNAIVNGSHELLRRAIENIVRNASQYTAKNTQAEVSLSVVDNEVQIMVVDYGPGVPEADVPHIFEPFYRVAKARERETGGVGIGLAITEQAVKTHGGRVFAQNTQDHTGLRVTLFLPQAT